MITIDDRVQSASGSPTRPAASIPARSYSFVIIGGARAACPSALLTTNSGFVMGTIARFGLTGKMAHDDFVCPPSVSARDHPARRLALCAFHAQLSRRRRPARRARPGRLLRNGAAMGIEVRADVRPRTSPSTPAANVALASRRDDRNHCAAGSSGCGARLTTKARFSTYSCSDGATRLAGQFSVEIPGQISAETDME